MSASVASGSDFCEVGVPEGGLEASTWRWPSGVQRTSTHLPSKSFASWAEIAGSKHVARRTFEFRALTAQCERMSGASLALRTSTARTPSGTSSSPLTAPLRRIVGVLKTLSWMCIILSMSWSSPRTGLSTVEINCHGGSWARPRSTGSKRCSARLTAIRDVPRSTSSTKTSMFRWGTPTCAPRKAAFGPIRLWHLSESSPTMRLSLSLIAFSSRALSVAPFHRCAAQSGANFVQSARIAWSSSSIGMCPTREVNITLS
mmetsp:Transcript_37613/g.116893  ORF Transcript_37613/g.116893 Transcript_37613/m.116893 type:complete len:259 (-) Transcript_37613:1314-2090(-)